MRGNHPNFEAHIRGAAEMEWLLIGGVVWVVLFIWLTDDMDAPLPALPGVLAILIGAVGSVIGK